MVLASELEHFENDIQFRGDIYYTFTLNLLSFAALDVMAAVITKALQSSNHVFYVFDHLKKTENPLLCSSL